MSYRVTFQVSYLKKTVDLSGIILQVPVIDCIADGIFFRLQIYAFFCQNRNRVYVYKLSLKKNYFNVHIFV